MSSTTPVPAPGLAMMYQVQAPAYEAARAYAPTTTYSTPTTPPTFTPADLVAAAARKRAIIADLPAACAHCGASFAGVASGPCVVELKGGEIVAYCKAAGGCGRSQVLFVQPDLNMPEYEQVCVFEADPDHPAPPPAMAALVGPQPDAPCRRCERLYRDHPQGYDTNGWRVSRQVPQPFPEGWPTWQPATKSWS
ncbi:uncharacterized protein ACA1_096690 [Acanthamoeba castellanii str. Neff]|uniref:Uncharacterized protein n=1 Tax=Acanthamoeba castellanii (strain ATCC 30010 / Neff) TaxID=1257118 RepID=L8GJ10_ACACF|nr:uncharacterized protein ACA1_096690 [Acanthamoeba castellanii str. Neff]ELR12997.1 hypothetical protein ACA1_096690 [Acanthamoeba castellanii str. Neff]